MREEFADADLTHEWVPRYRIPLVRSVHPSWRYEVALAVPGPDSDLVIGSMQATWPTEAEAAIVGSYIGYRRAWYRPGYAKKMLERALDVDGSTNTTVLVRRPDSWGYRRSTWTIGPVIWPPTAEMAAAMRWAETPPVYPPGVEGLIALLDRINDLTDRWPDWKAAHPEVFAPVTSDAEA